MNVGMAAVKNVRFKIPELEDGPLALLSSSFGAVWSKRFRLGFWVVLCIVAGAYYARSTSPTFTATASLLLETRPATMARSDQGVGSQSSSIDTGQAESQIQVIRSERLLATVFDGLGLSTEPELAPAAPGVLSRLSSGISAYFGRPTRQESIADELTQMAFRNFAGRFNVRRVGLSYVLEVSYASGNPSQARRIANATVSAYLAQSLKFKTDLARGGAEFLQSRVNTLVAETQAAVAGISAGTLPTGPTPDADARVISAALQPLTRSAPKTGLIIAFAGTIGVMTGFLALALGQALDTRVRTEEDLARSTGVPCLGTIPEFPRRTRSLRRKTEFEMSLVAVSEPDGAFARAIRDLRTAIMLSIDDYKHASAGHAIAVASWSPDSGCTLICANLARVVRDSGHGALLIDADVHRSGFGLTSQVGLVKVGLADALVNGGSLNTISVADFNGIPLVPARSSESGRIFNAYLGSPELSALVGEGKALGDVFIDLPPLSSTGDARAAAACADAVVLVAVAGKTKKKEVVRALMALEATGAPILGTVLNRTKI